MPLFPASPKKGEIPVYNSACPWASSADDIKALYLSPFTAAVTTRTCTLNGFADDASKHQVAFFGTNAQSSSNSYGYSPYAITVYLDWLRPLLLSKTAAKKQVVVSITGTLEETKEMLKILQAFADEVKAPIGAEFNASCPNFRGHPPPAYVETELTAFVKLLASHSSSTLLVGIKLPPYTYDSQFTSVISALSSVSSSGKESPISFLSSTNTLGQGLVFAPQIVEVKGNAVAQKKKPQEQFALPGGFGGLAGAAVHQISLGNVYRLSNLLKASEDTSLRSISLIGVGGVADAEGAERFRQAGASAVACASALGREGIDVFAKISGGLKAKL